MINDSCQSVLPALLPLFIYTYGLSLEQAGFLILANTALSSLLQPLLGYISDKINQPRLIAFGVLLEPPYLRHLSRCRVFYLPSRRREDYESPRRWQKR